MSRYTPLVIGNWKMNPQSAGEAKKIATAVRAGAKKYGNVEVVVAPPFPFLSSVASLASASLHLGAQDVFYEEKGAFTGEVSLSMLASFGVRYVILGHSERRAMGETDELVQKKVQATLARHLTPVVCVGERERDSQGNFFNLVEAQVRSLATVLKPAHMKRVVIAYEPIWAIGTGQTATAENVKEMQLFITTVLSKVYDRTTAKAVRIIYGGSVKADNALTLHQEGGMGGFLVGGASLTPADFIEIIKATTHR